LQWRHSQAVARRSGGARVSDRFIDSILASEQLTAVHHARHVASRRADPSALKGLLKLSRAQGDLHSYADALDDC
jgi:hypothetical protein